MKRAAAMLLAAVLLFALIPFAGAAFTDADKISEGHREAVEYVSAKGVISGFPDGSFKPAETLTRAQAAKILCVALEGTEKANALTKTDTGFSDVPESHWAAKFVAYCVDKGIVAGVGNGKFDPDGKLTAVAFAKMLLVAYGREKAENLVGSSWQVNTQKAMRTDRMNDGATVSVQPTTRENACHLVQNFMLQKEVDLAEPEAYKTVTLDLTKPGSYRLLGRAQQSEQGVVCDYSADGVEFTCDCKGTISIKANSTWLTVNNHVTYRAIVDGEPGPLLSQARVTTAKQDSDLIARLRVAPGKHTIRIVKDFEITQSLDLLKSVTLTCKPDTLQATQPKDKMLLVIGDSTSAGFGIIPTDTPETTRNSACATRTHGYLTAQALDMDYELVVKGSGGIVKKYANAGATPRNQQELYEFQNAYRDAETHYSFPRKAAAAVVKVSGNDGSIPAAEYEEGVRALFANIRKHNGADIPIILVYYNGRAQTPVAEKLIAEDPKVYGVIGVSDGKGMGQHPSLQAHATTTERILEVLKPLLGMN